MKRQKQSFEKYENPEHGISLSYPADWTKVDDVAGGTVAFVAPAKKKQQEARKNLLISVQDLSEEEISLSEYMELNMQVLTQSGKQVKMLKHTETELAKNPAHKLVFKIPFKNTSIVHEQIYMMCDDIAYVLTFSASEKEYNELSREILEISKTFEVTGKQCLAG